MTPEQQEAEKKYLAKRDAWWAEKLEKEHPDWMPLGPHGPLLRDLYPLIQFLRNARDEAHARSGDEYDKGRVDAFEEILQQLGEQDPSFNADETEALVRKIAAEAGITNAYQENQKIYRLVMANHRHEIDHDLLIDAIDRVFAG